MSNLALNKYSPLVDITEQESGDISNPIWILVNPKYPADIYDIWNPILYEIQDKVYRKIRSRIDARNIFIKNAVSDIGIVPNTSKWGAAEVAREVVKLRESVLEYQPKIIITFGTITFEYVRRVFEIKNEIGPKYWSTTNLEDEFEQSIANFDINQTNRIPLRHRVMKSSFFEDRNYSSWEDSENYFRDVATKISEKIIENKDSLKIWIE